MSGSESRPNLDAFTGRDVVYCHACENQWFQDQHGLVCPQCHSEATEIVTPENDPRPIDAHGTEAESQGHRDQYDDSDPEEGDIEEHSHRAPGGIYFTSRVFRMPLNHGEGTETSPAHPADGNAVMERFYEMMSRDLGPSGAPGASNPGDTRSTTGPRPNEYSGARHYTTRTTMFPGGSSSFTITTAPLQRDGNNPPIGEFDAYADPHPRNRRRIVIVVLGSGGADSHASILSAIMGNITNPVGNSPHRVDTSSNAEDRDLPPHGFPIAFQQLLGALMAGSSGTRNWGDVVTSQEEFDRIISQMMEANPMSNAAPPASEAAIQKLERKNIDQKMLGTDDKVECTICMDDMNLGDEATVLPCKHFFHGECVTIWLKEHNTCPICRTPIEQRNSAGSTQASQDQTSSASRSARPEPPRGLFPWAFQPSGNIAGSFMPSTSQRSSPSSRQPSHTESQQNEARHTSGRRELLRSPSTNEERLRAIRDLGNSDSHRGSDRPTMPPFGGQRRNSLSPPSPSMQAPWNLSYDPIHDYTGASRDRTRERDEDRSNSQNSFRFTHTNRDHDGHGDRERHRQQSYRTGQPASHELRDQERSDDNDTRRNDAQQTSNGSTFDPFSWIRDRLPGGGNSSGDSHRRG